MKKIVPLVVSVLISEPAIAERYLPSQSESGRPATGTLVTVFAKSKTFCGEFRLNTSSEIHPTEKSLDLPEGAEPIGARSYSPYEYAGEYGHYSFDINNDGRREEVVGLHERTRARDGDTYFIFPAKKKFLSHWLSVLETPEVRRYMLRQPLIYFLGYGPLHHVEPKYPSESNGTTRAVIS